MGIQNQNKTETRKHHSKTRSLIKILLLTLLVAIILKSFFIEAYRIPTSSMEKTLMAGDFIFVNKASYSLSLRGTLPLVNVKLPDYNFFTYSKPSQGDVVIFLFSQDWNEDSKAENYVKRVVGEPGDTIEIIDNIVFVNGRKLLDDKINLGSRIKNVTVDKKVFLNKSYWNGKDLSPVIIPWKGLTIEVNHNNIDKIGPLINREFEKNVISIEGSVINIEGKSVRTYTFQQDHFFVLGDNRDVSMDSRYWGTIPENLIIGKALMIYWSTDPSLSFLNSIRFERLFKIIE